MKLANCRSCHASIIWAKTHAGKAMPVDAEPVANGNIALGIGDPPLLSVNPPDFVKGPRYVSHFVTCKFAVRHRKAIA